MEWSKSTITKSELERKQREFMEQALKMAEKAIKPQPEEPPVYEEETIPVSEPEIIEKTEENEPVEIFEEPEPMPTAENISEEECGEEPEAMANTEPAKETSFGVFGKEELEKAIESGEIKGEGVMQAAEILAEMNRKTEYMKKLINEQEKEANSAKLPQNGGSYGLNGFVDRHNNKCQGCRNGNRINTP